MTVPLPTADGSPSPANSILAQALALMDEPIDTVIHTVVAATMAYAVRAGMTPRDVSEVLFQQMPSDENWHVWAAYASEREQKLGTP